MNQDELDELFPVGMELIQAGEDGNAILTPRLLLVEENAERTTTTVTCQAIEFEKDVTFEYDTMEMVSPGVFVFHTTNDGPDMMATTNLNEGVLRNLVTTRQEWYGDY
jgi:hypothetical protein